MRSGSVGNQNRKGKSFTEEQKERISLSVKKTMSSLEVIEKMRRAKLGKKQSPETIAKRIASIKANKVNRNNYPHASEDAKQRWQNPEYRAKQIANHKGMTGKKMTEESKRKIGEKHRGMKRSPEAVENIKRGNQGKNIGRVLSEETKQKIGESSKEHWQDPEFRQKAVTATMKACHMRPTKPELELGIILERLYPSEYRYVGDGGIVIDGLCPDFIHVERNRVILMHGDYWQ